MQRPFELHEEEESDAVCRCKSRFQETRRALTLFFLSSTHYGGLESPREASRLLAPSRRCQTSLHCCCCLFHDSSLLKSLHCCSDCRVLVLSSKHHEAPSYRRTNDEWRGGGCSLSSSVNVFRPKGFVALYRSTDPKCTHTHTRKRRVSTPFCLCFFFLCCPTLLT